MVSKVISGSGSRNENRSSGGIHNTRNGFLKRVFDFSVALALLVLLLPVMTVIALAIMVQDGRPFFFGHRRVGRNGKAFTCWKFRTMVRDADARLAELLARDPAARQEWEATRKLKEDPRIIPGIGPFLRKSSLDELPQFFNVLLGEMSLVGPRPVVTEELEMYGSARALYTSVRPGVTGPWQIGSRNDDDYEDRVSKDVDYVENWSFARDVEIVVKTAAVPFKQSGAY